MSIGKVRGGFKAVHFKEDGKGKCWNGPMNPNFDETKLTEDKAKVTCQNCITTLSREARNKQIDWDAAMDQVALVLPKVAATLEMAFGRGNGYEVETKLENYPPRIVVEMYSPAASYAPPNAPYTRKRLTVGYNIGTNGEPNYIQVLILSDEQEQKVADYVGELAEEVGLRPKRLNLSAGVLRFELRYGKQEKIRATLSGVPV